MRYSKTRSHEKYLNTVAVFFNEIVKLIVSLIIFILLSKSIKCALKDLKYHFITNFLDSFKVGIPALIYTIQNILLYVAIEHLEASTFMVRILKNFKRASGFLKKRLFNMKNLYLNFFFSDNISNKNINNSHFCRFNIKNKIIGISMDFFICAYCGYNFSSIGK